MASSASTRPGILPPSGICPRGTPFRKSGAARVGSSVMVSSPRSYRREPCRSIKSYNPSHERAEDAARTHMLQLGRRSVTVAAVPALLLVCAALALALAPSNQRGPGRKWSGRTPTGQPDLQGVWTNYDPTPFERLSAGERPPQQPAVSTADWLVQDSPISAR